MDKAEIKERSLRDKIRELRAENAALVTALAALRSLTKASTPRATGGGAPDFVLFKLPKDGALRSRGIGILGGVDKLLGKTGMSPEADAKLEGAS